ncbi:hypothetical protein [Williamsia sp. CHRR-6]|uniref:hypothetical protein n=1 Tax=Williamsia sp. CHRR-6 TaxID=2835871 RepID=UPI001BDA41DB|nr:hypothetical protein [Williamsia sp. CHRR-6]MBT0568611.1 hypothetical protein [Williamsia sp. CHRR-6]
MKKWFADDVAPELDTVVVLVPGGSVVALVFSTDRATYAVTVADHQVSREVPGGKQIAPPQQPDLNFYPCWFRILKRLSWS